MPSPLVTTRQLHLRPLVAADLGDPDVLRWHTDPEGYRNMSEEPYRSADEFRASAREWVAGWEGGPSYWLALDKSSDKPLGIGGVRRLEFGGQAYANLYYRLDPGARGRGLARELATAAVAYSREWHPELTITCRVAARNTASHRVARSSGMRAMGEWRSDSDPVDQPASTLYVAPAVLVGPPENDCGYDELLALWQSVNAAGGAVGFVGEAPRAEVAAALDAHLAQIEAGDSQLVRLAEPTMDTWNDPTDHGSLLGFGFAHRFSGVAAHRVNLERVMVDPHQQRRGLGRVLMADLHAFARRTGAELATISYRGSTDLGDFYAGAGYVETGRLPGGLRIPEEQGTRDVDDVQMAYRLDGRNTL